MAARDHHTALRSEVQGKANAGHLELVLAKLQSGKDDISFTLHVGSSIVTYGGNLQITDWLRSLGFQQNASCQFTNARQCFSKVVPESYDLQLFATTIGEGFVQIQKAEEGFGACGFWLPLARQLSPPAQAFRKELRGNGHTALSTKVMNASEDDKFAYKFTFVDTGQEKGFVTHYRPRHPPLSSEVQSVFRYIGLKEIPQCPEFEFESCHYRTLQLFETDNPFQGNVDFAHQSFGAHAARFSLAVEALLAAHAAAERVGLTFLPIARALDRSRDEIVRRIGQPTNTKSRPSPTMAFDAALPSSFDVAISFAGTERDLAEKLAQLLRAAGGTVFYDNFYPEHLWGKNLTAFLDEIYRKRAKFCVIFVSEEYRTRKWTNHELRSAQAKALEQKGEEYILPVRVDATDLDGLPTNVGYVDVSLGIDKIAQLLLKKLRP